MNSLTNEHTRIGFIGIGNMGSRIARRLLDHGYQLMAYNRSSEAADALANMGARSPASLNSHQSRCLLSFLLMMMSLRVCTRIHKVSLVISVAAR